MGKSFSGCEIIEIAIQIEKNGIDFYNGLIEMSKHDKAKEVFKYLAQQEEEHIRIFKGIFDPKCSYEPQGAYPDEYFAYMNALASGYIFTKENKGKEIASGVKNDKEAIDLGIKFEKESILFYEGMRKIVPDKDQQLLERVINEEKEHLKKLCELKGDVPVGDTPCA